MKRFALLSTFVVSLVVVGCQPPPSGGPAPSSQPVASSTPAAPTADWKRTLDDRLQALGHRNWIVVADSAYPWQVSPGIETVVTGADQLEVVQAVLEAVKAAPHVQAEVFLDSELQFVPEEEAAGVGAYRTALQPLLGDASVTRTKHEEIISMLDQAGSKFKILLLKTTMTIPYTSVFVRLNAGYWGPVQEAKLREIIKGGVQPTAGAAQPQAGEPKPAAGQ